MSLADLPRPDLRWCAHVGLLLTTAYPDIGWLRAAASNDERAFARR